MTYAPYIMPQKLTRLSQMDIGVQAVGSSPAPAFVTAFAAGQRAARSMLGAAVVEDGTSDVEAVAKSVGAASRVVAVSNSVGVAVGSTEACLANSAGLGTADADAEMTNSVIAAKRVMLFVLLLLLDMVVDRLSEGTIDDDDVQ